MKRELVFTCGSVLLVVGAACAGAEDDPAEADPDPGSALGDAASPGESVDPDVLGPDGCSAAGWCATQLPDTDLTLKDIWPLPGHAFAIAESPTRGVKVLEWTDAAAKWVYIDDNSQNQALGDLYAGKVWAPSADEVYFTVAPRTIYHGKRQNQPNPGWAWAHQQLDDRVPQYPASSPGDHYRGRPTYGPSKITYTALGVVGTGPDDVYAWYANAIYHRVKDRNGNETWEVEYVADDRDAASEQIFFASATAAGKDDVWFAGGRGGAPGSTGCPVVVHKTAAGYRRVSDGTPVGGNTSTLDGGIPPLAFDGGLQPFDGGIVFPPLDGGLQPFDRGLGLGAQQFNGGFDFGDGGIVLPPPGDGGIVLPPPGDGGIVLPPPGDGGLTLDGGIIITPDGGTPILDGGLPLLDAGPPPAGVAMSCKARAGSILLGSGVGWIPSISAIAPQQVVMLKGGREIVKLVATGDDYAATLTTLPNKPSHLDFVSLFSAPNDDIWLGGTNIILRTGQELADGGSYQVSTISLTGAWLETPIYQIRGSSNVDRWAVGARYALHKTTP